MYAYASGSPGTFGCETASQLSGIGCPWAMRTAGIHGGPAVYMRGPGFGADPAPAPAASGSSWSDVFAATVGGLASIFSLSTQAKLTTQARHSAERTAALNAQTAATQAQFFPQVVGQTPPPAAGGGMGTTLLVVGGVAVAGVAAFLLLRKRRGNPLRRLNPFRRARRRAA